MKSRKKYGMSVFFARAPPARVCGNSMRCTMGQRYISIVGLGRAAPAKADQ